MHHVYSTMKKSPESFRGELMHTVFVDEVQDLRPSQIALFQFVCANPKGYMFGGDTAQTIAQGVGFRFETVKDVFFQEFFNGAEGASELMPKTFPLSQNFRTHEGIVSLANNVVDLIHHFFPLSIDKLPPETSRVLGPQPIFIDTDSSLMVELFQAGEMHSCEFGAEQVILVRDEAEKNNVMSISGSGALVLTVLEAKGMVRRKSITLKYCVLIDHHLV